MQIIANILKADENELVTLWVADKIIGTIIFNAGGITVENGNLLIEDSEITNNMKVIQLIYSTMVMKRCLVDGNWHTGNAWGEGII